MVQATTIAKKTIEDTKKRTDASPEAVEKARRKVAKHVRANRPGPATTHVDSAPDTKPS